MQGTAAVVLAAAFAGVHTAGTRVRDQRVVIHGAGTAGVGIADIIRDVMVSEGLSRQEAARRFYLLDHKGLITDDRPSMYDFQQPYARPAGEVAEWRRCDPDAGANLADTVARARPTMLIGTSTEAGAFTEAIVRQLATTVGPSSCRCPTPPRRPRRYPRI